MDHLRLYVDDDSTLGESGSLLASVGNGPVAYTLAQVPEAYASTSSNPYVPWDVGVLQVFSNWIKTSIGAGMTAGVLIFAVIMGICVVIKVVRRFTHN